MRKFLGSCVREYYKFLNSLHTNETPLFIFGCRRGGTTLLQRLLNSVHSVTIWGEQGYFLKKVAEAYFNRIELSDPGPQPQLQVHEHMYRYALRKTIKDPKFWSGWAQWYGEDRFRENFRKFIKSFYAPSFLGAKHWGFKEVRYGCNDRVIEFLQDIFPKARFIYIVRDSASVIRSQLAWNNKGSLGKHIHKWNMQCRFYHQVCLKNKDKSFFIRYEDMIDERSPALEDLFEFLNFRFSDKQKKVMRLKDGRGATRKEWKETALSEDDVQRILDETQEVRKLLGYGWL